MIVPVDSSIWIDHLRRGERGLVRLLEANRVGIHPSIIGELAGGTLKHRASLIEHFLRLPRVPECSSEEAMHLIEKQHLWGRGLGWIDVQLLASSRLAGCQLWTRDRGLLLAATELSLAFVESC